VDFPEPDLLVFLEGMDHHKSSIDLLFLLFETSDSLVQVMNCFLGSATVVKDFPDHSVKVGCLQGGVFWKVFRIFKSSFISSIGGYSG
jgi:hypothetical protein